VVSRPVAGSGVIADGLVDYAGNKVVKPFRYCEIAQQSPADR